MNENNIHASPNMPIADDGYWDALLAEEEQHVFPADPIEEGDDGEERPFTTDTLSTAWQLAQTHYDDSTPITATVSGYNRGGLLIHWNNLGGFIPSSHLVELLLSDDDEAKLAALAAYVDKEVTVKIIRLEPENRQFVLSERAAQSDNAHAEHLLQTLQVGETITGTVTNITNFGVFVDIGGVEGLIHISELSWSRVRHPGHILQVGTVASVKVLRVEPENARIALSLKQMKPDPWQTAEAHYHPDQMVTGTITHITNYGAFVLLEDQLEGLIHLSELAEGSFMHPRNVVSMGETVTARVMTVDGSAKRLALSLRPKVDNE
jgi:small subunit ribosomal protein S1